eukprot:g6193.t1
MSLSQPLSSRHCSVNLFGCYKLTHLTVAGLHQLQHLNLFCLPLTQLMQASQLYLGEAVTIVKIKGLQLMQASQL